MGFKRTTQQLSLVTAGVTLDTIGKEQMKALIDWIGADPGGGIPTKEIFGRVVDASDALRFEFYPNRINATRIGLFLWDFTRRMTELGLSDFELVETID